ncbi:unnamed protein product [Lepeophtheirus salmonis]|uniref:(salmon louse) hypothetical protein n=1 Tax=Lepeophtheirus salmonis TaxID=72036 RepID=A0A7R8CI13_LEPSM|nr:unnamed protein product [Lepeophtheirus salmonis]CAF2828330.1 unnamed protein product [Lepeophtheirus salmonis]
MILLIILSIFISLRVQVVQPHGRLIEPPSRSSMWRYGFHSPPNYNDHELYCGGYSRQWQKNGGKCGICGDPWDSNVPRDNEAGGIFGQGIITRKYEKGSPIKIRIQLTANHMGYFEFRICPNNNKKQPASQKCLDQYVLEKRNAPGTKYYPGPGAKIFETTYSLPTGLTCSQCVLQWKYVAGNNWGMCKNGTGAVGCGPQEEFRACSDITITELDGSADDTANDIFDPIQYTPTVSTSTTTMSSTTSDIEFVDNNDLDADVSYEDRLAEELRWESMILIILASILFTGVFFCSFFLYFLKIKDVMQNFNKKRDLSSPYLEGGSNGKSCDFITKSKKKKVTISSELPTIYTNEAVLEELESEASSENGNPVPPPRIKKLIAASANGGPPPRLATINARGPIQRPSLPPPTAPDDIPLLKTPPILQISHPTSVTINGVSVARSVPLQDSIGVIAQARLALANDEIPDSSVESTTLPPPPVPTTKPPTMDEE